MCSNEQVDEFARRMRALVMGEAERKGYVALESLKEQLGVMEGHAVGEMLSKLTRYQLQRDVRDLEKLAAWACLLWSSQRVRQAEFRGVVDE